MLKKLRFYYWLVKGFFQKHKFIIIPAAVVGAVTFIQLPFLLKYAPQPKPTTHIGRVGSYTLSNLPRDIQVKVSSGLTTIDETGLPQPALASDWRVIDEGTTYVFTLADDITWQDGEPISASDINYTINGVTSEIQDDKTIIFRLEEPFSPFPSIVSQPLFKRKNTSYLQVVDRTKIIGVGEYEIKKLKFDGPSLDYIVLESPQERLVYRFYTTEQAAILAFKLAEIDVIEDLSSLGELESWESLTIESNVNHDEYVAMFFDLNDNNLNNKKLRQALTYLIKKPEDPNIRALGPLKPDSWAYNPNVKPYDYSQETAAELFEGLNPDIEIELTTTPSFTRLAEDIKTEWETLGIRVRIKIVNEPDLNNFQALLIGQRIPSDPDQYLLWHSTQETNLTGYDSVKVDKLLVDGRTQLDVEAREDIYLDFQRFIVEDSPAAFIRYLETFTVKRN